MDIILTVGEIVFQSYTSHWRLIDVFPSSLKGENLPWPTNLDKINELGAALQSVTVMAFDLV